MTEYKDLRPGDPVPFFKQATRANPRFNFDTVGGRYIVLGLMGAPHSPAANAAMAVIAQRRVFFNDERAAFFGVVAADETTIPDTLQDRYPGIRFFLDADYAVARLFGAVPCDGEANEPFRPMWVVMDPGFHIIEIIPMDAEGAHATRLNMRLDALPPVDRFLGIPMEAPILLVPNVFGKKFCADLIDLYKEHGGDESGFMREVDGQTVGMVDHSHKRRRDFTITDQKVIGAIQAQFLRRVVPAIKKAYQFEATRMERYIVAEYSASEAGHFRPHRDNTTKGTAHRRFAASVNLNADFDGGEISFPEYGTRTYKGPPGAALIFSCSILHTVSPVTRGERFACLPFLYDDAAAEIRQNNLNYLAETPEGHLSED